MAERLSKALGRYRQTVSKWHSRRDVANNEMKASSLSDPWNGLYRQFRMLREVTPDNPQIPAENKNVQRLAIDILSGVADALVPYVNALITRDLGNMQASANIVVNGETVAENVPAVSLIALEFDFKDLLTLVKEIPEAPAGENWTIDVNARSLVSEPSSSLRTVQQRRAIPTAPETDRHPAQYHIDTEAVPVAEIISTRFHGGMLLAEKRALISTVEAVLLGISNAREEANAAFETELVTGVGERLLQLALPGAVELSSRS